MSQPVEGGTIDSQVLVEIIKAQTEIAKQGLDLGGVMVFVADRIRLLTNAAGAVVELVDGDEMVYRAASGMAQSQLGLRLRRDGSLSGLCIQRHEMLYCDDSETDDRVDREACRRVGLRSMIVAPLDHDGTPVGVLKLASPAPGAFTQQDILVLSLMSELIASAMYHAAVYERDELYRRATHDALTGLANRALFYDRLRQRVVLAHRQRSPFGILNLDLDRLKAINDEHGHRAGDAAIREAAQRIRRVSREADTVARLGGDEFGVILSDLHGPGGAQRHAERIAQEIALPFRFEDAAIPLAASIGTAIYPDQGTDIEVLMETADRAMYRQKRTHQAAQGL
jgi:diguanylate cyclase (GGDEF)-like protein